MTMTIADTIDTIQEYADIVIEDTTKLPREDWLAERREGLGGSDCAAALGFSPWSTPYAKFEEKAHGIVNDEDNERMEWGRRLEGAIVQAYGERTSTSVTPYPVMLRSKKYPWMQVNLDAIGPAHAVEAKNVGLRMAREWEDGQVPDWYMLQGMHELAVTGLPKVVFAVLVGGQELRIIEVERNDELIGDVIEQERRFWELVKSDTPPGIDGSAATTEALKLRYALPDPGKAVDLPEDILELVDQRKGLKAIEKQTKEDLALVENTIKGMLGDAEFGMVNGIEVVTWKLQTRKGYEVQPTSFRKLHVPTKKGKR